MSIQITEEDSTYLINIQTDEKAALAAYFNGEERIYLPEASSSNTTYYTETTEALTPTEDGYILRTDKKPDKVELLT